MADYEFRKPHPIMLPRDQARRDILTPYELEDFLGDVIWSWPKWKEDGYCDAQVKIGEAIEATAPGEMVQLELPDWEKLRDACKEQPIQGRYAPRLRFWANLIRAAKRIKHDVPAEGKKAAPADATA